MYQDIKTAGGLTLDYFEALQSDDDVKTDLELTCTKCDTVLCDVESSDSMQVLLSVVLAHVCGQEPQ